MAKRVSAGFLVLVLILGGTGWWAYNKLRVAFLGDGCKVTVNDESVSLDLEEAPNAATIAAVAHRRKLPERAVVIALATAEQESHIENIDYGDRDSVGIFQQRPSQGWGTEKQLVDPVYASERFYGALVKVKGYQKLDLHDAAQRVQRSADGSLYAQHENMAQILAGGFTGRIPGAVTCWYPQDRSSATPDHAKALTELVRNYGSATETLPGGAKAPSRDLGWSYASWLVSHAATFGIKKVRFDGHSWTPADGSDGWSDSDTAPTDRVLIS
ncbi:MAG: hypothetical protein ABIS86_08945 [Streptosporangiaceae bacterium]